jgi:hypothetical protein
LAEVETSPRKTTFQDVPRDYFREWVSEEGKACRERTFKRQNKSGENNREKKRDAAYGLSDLVLKQVYRIVTHTRVFAQPTPDQKGHGVRRCYPPFSSLSCKHPPETSDNRIV